MTHGPGHPVDVRRLECRDLAERVVMELAERDHRGLRVVERWCRRSPEVAHPVTDQRPRRCRRARRLAPNRVIAERWLTRQGRAPCPVADGLVARSVRAAGVDPTGHRARGLWWRRATPPSWSLGLERGTVGAVAGRRRPTRRWLAGERRVGVVDLGHPARGRARRRRIVAGEIRVIGPCESPPGGLDLRRRGARFNAENVPGVSPGHPPECRPPTRPFGRVALDSRCPRAVP